MGRVIVEGVGDAVGFFLFLVAIVVSAVTSGVFIMIAAVAVAVLSVGMGAIAVLLVAANAVTSEEAARRVARPIAKDWAVSWAGTPTEQQDFLEKPGVAPPTPTDAKGRHPSGFT